MARHKIWNKKQIIKTFFAYGLHLWLMVFVLNIGLYYVAHFYSIGRTCFSTAQVASDNRCLYIWSGKVYEKGSRNSPHMGHPCGTDVTSVIPPSHIGNQAKYLLPNYVGDICVAAPPPTLVPKPTSTPVPTAKPTPLPTATPVPNQTIPPTVPPIIVPTSKPLPTPTIKPAVGSLLPPTATPKPLVNSQNPVATAIPTAFLQQKAAVVQPTVGVIVPTSTLKAVNAPIVSPTIAAPVGPAISFAFTLPGIGSMAANLNPLHQVRTVSLSLYQSTDNMQDLSVRPSYSLDVQAQYDANSSSSTYGMFVVRQADLGSGVPAGDYQIAFKTNQTLRTLIADTNNSGIIFHLSAGADAGIMPQVTSVISGDLNGDNTIDIQDYILFVNCYGSKAQQSECTTPVAADLNDDGLVDGIDYIIMLEGIQSLIAQGKVVLPTVQPTVVPTFSPTSTRTIATVPTAVLSVAPTISIPAKHMVVTPTPVIPRVNPVKLLFSASSGIFLSKIFSLLAFFLLVGVGILGAYKSRMITALLHRDTTKEAKTLPSSESSPQAVPSGKNQIVKVCYLSQAEVVNGRYMIKITDKSGSRVGCLTQLPPPDGYYTITGYEEDVDGAPCIIIQSLIPSAKPAKDA